MGRVGENTNKDKAAKRERKQGVYHTYHKQMKAPFVTYADFECLLRKLQGCAPPKDGSFAVKKPGRDA